MGSTVRYTVVVDALRMLCTGKIPALHDGASRLIANDKYIITDNIMLQRNHRLTHPGFNYCFNILLKDKTLGQIYYGNNNKYRYAQQDISQVTIENHVLYQSDWLDKVCSVLLSLELEFYKYSYMEIAVDGFDFVEQHTKLTYNKRLARKRHVQIFPLLDDKLKTNISYRLGSTKSEKSISIYDKSMELKISNKEYISEFWHRNGLHEQDMNIHRCELRVHDKALKLFSSDMTNMNNPSYLASYFKSVAGSYLEFYKKDKPTSRHNLIDWMQFDDVIIIKEEVTYKATNKNRYKSMLRNLFEEYVITNDEQYLHTLASITARYNLMNWLHGAVSRWIKEFRLTL